MLEKTLPTIGLNCIVKNESKVIARMLKSVAPLIDYYVIVDTGSTDNTKEIIKSTMDDLGIPGEIHDHEWVDFCTARNYALEMLKGKSEYGFWIDADEQAIFEDNFSKDKLIHGLRSQNIELGSTEVEYGPQKYFRSQIFKVDMDWIWEGAVHEILTTKGKEGRNNIRAGRVEGFRSLVTPDGASWGDGSKETQRKKYLEHAEMLTEYIKTNKDVRWVFYLAQSYRDAFEWEKAEYWYGERVKLGGGYWEELYFSQLMVASMQANQKKLISEVLHSYQECCKYDTNRCEHLMPVIRHHQSTRNYPMAYMISKYCLDNCSKNPFPKSTLFIDNQVYDWQILDLHCVNAYYMGKHGEARSAYNKLRKAINKGLVPEAHVKRIKDNEQWYTKKHEANVMNQRKQHAKMLKA